MDLQRKKYIERNQKKFIAKENKPKNLVKKSILKMIAKLKNLKDHVWFWVEELGLSDSVKELRSFF